MDGTAHHHVGVGDHAAGIAAAPTMRQHGFQGQVTVVETRGDLPYERTPLSKALTDGDPAIAQPIVPASVYLPRPLRRRRRRRRAMCGMLSVLAELQRELIVANTNDGLAAARARGRVGGRRPS